MTLIIVAGEIDLSVASIARPDQRADGLRCGTPAGRSRRSSRPCLVARRAGRRAQRLPGHPARPAVARGHHRHARPVPRARLRRARRPGGGRLPGQLHETSAPAPIAGTDIPYPIAPVRRAGRRLRGRAARHAVRPLGVRDRRQRGGRALLRHPRQAGPSSACIVVSGAMAALAGIVFTLRYASARADNGAGLELAVVAAVLLGGVSIFGGKGTARRGRGRRVPARRAPQNALILNDVSNDSPQRRHRAAAHRRVLAPERQRGHRPRRSAVVAAATPAPGPVRPSRKETGPCSQPTRRGVPAGGGRRSPWPSPAPSSWPPAAAPPRTTSRTAARPPPAPARPTRTPRSRRA